MSALSAMRARVKLQSPARVADEIGGVAISWTNEADVWAEIEARGVGETAAFDANASRASYRVTINRFDGVRAGWRIAWDARRLRVVGVADDGAARIELQCEEETL
ncbi:MAG: phage head closure protein [Hyphomonadaceae bacterium]|nr:phage head closure protein [Hyphomonadaceae bacterium]